MEVKLVEPHHFKQIIRIHEKHFKNEFPLSDVFDNKVLNKFAVVDDNDNVITFGGIKLLFELFLITDLDRNPRDRVIALKTFLANAIHESRKREFEQVHCFPTHEEDNWIKILKRIGFTETKGRALYMNL